MSVEDGLKLVISGGAVSPPGYGKRLSAADDPTEDPGRAPEGSGMVMMAAASRLALAAALGVWVLGCLGSSAAERSETSH